MYYTGYFGYAPKFFVCEGASIMNNYTLFSSCEKAVNPIQGAVYGKRWVEVAAPGHANLLSPHPQSQDRATHHVGSGMVIKAC